MVPAASVRIPRAPTYSGPFSFPSDVSFTGLSPSLAGLPMPFSYIFRSIYRKSFYPSPQAGLGSFLFARHYSGYHSYFLLLQVLRCFSSLRLAWSLRPSLLFVEGFPHSDIGGSFRLLTAPRRVSPFAASFFASLCLGIRHMLFIP